MGPRPGPGFAGGAWRGLAWLLFLALAVAAAVPVAYPLPLRPLLEEEAARCGVDPLLLAAVIRRESGFRPRAVSDQGALGLMQVMPETGAWVSRQLGIAGYEPRLLLDPAFNVRVGCWYLAYLLRRFDRDPVLALAAYNGGEGTVDQWLASGRWHPDRGPAAIPYPETRNFVRNVLRDYQIYRWVYRDLPRLVNRWQDRG